MPLGDQQAFTWAAAFVLGISLGRLVRRWCERRREPPHLQGAVANSSLLAAAFRAVESLELEEGKLFSDELAILLAGQKCFREALSLARAYQPPLEASSKPGRRLYQVSAVAARTWWFDRQILTALTSPAIPGTKGWLSARLTSSARGPSAPPRQVLHFLFF